MLNITAARKHRKGSAEVNIAPLIDMVFILLIFFLVTTSFVKETGVDVNRPTAATAVSKDKAGLLIAVDAEDRIFLDRREIDVRAVRANVERSLADTPDGRVVIVADRESRTGTIISVMDGCRLAGAKAVSVAARPPAE